MCYTHTHTRHRGGTCSSPLGTRLIGLVQDPKEAVCNGRGVNSESLMDTVLWLNQLL